jgi:hypothetical protein
MSEERDKVRCRSCELVQWSDRANCRRCGTALPEPIVRIVERVVEKVVIRKEPQGLQKLEQASRLSSTATERLTQQCLESVAPIVLAQVPETGVFPTMAEVERAMIVAAYERSNRRPLEAARLLGIGKTTVYRKLRAMGQRREGSRTASAPGGRDGDRQLAPIEWRLRLGGLPYLCWFQ